MIKRLRKVEKIKKAIEAIGEDLEKFRVGQLIIDFNGLSIGLRLKSNKKSVIIKPAV